MIKNLKTKRLPFWAQWLIHSFSIWFILNFNEAFTYWYKVRTNGNFLLKEDGTYATQWDRFININYYQNTILLILVFILIVEANYHFVFRKKNLAIFILSSIVAGLCFLGYLVYQSYKLNNQPPFDPFTPVLIFMGYCISYSVIRDFFVRRARKAELGLQQKEAEIKSLRAQVNPHFLFNTINSIYGLALEEKAERTAACTEQLADLMRFTMAQSGNDLIPVSEEIRFLRNYLNLQRIRIPENDRITIRTDIDYDGIAANIAPLLFIPFIENAFQYGLSMDRDCHIIMDLKIRNGLVTMDLKNSVIHDKKITGHGTGILNTTRRIELLYPDSHTIKIASDQSTYSVFLQIDLTKEKK